MCFDTNYGYYQKCYITYGILHHNVSFQRLMISAVFNMKINVDRKNTKIAPAGVIGQQRILTDLCKGLCI